MNALLMVELVSSVNMLLLNAQESLKLLQKADVTDEELKARILANISRMEALRDND
jgi:hypothetical protein